MSQKTQKTHLERLQETRQQILQKLADIEDQIYKVERGIIRVSDRISQKTGQPPKDNITKAA